INDIISNSVSLTSKNTITTGDITSTSTITLDAGTNKTITTGDITASSFILNHDGRITTGDITTTDTNVSISVSGTGMDIITGAINSGSSISLSSSAGSITSTGVIDAATFATFVAHGGDIDLAGIITADFASIL